jgi:SAM-dependent methyltransferase
LTVEVHPEIGEGSGVELPKPQSLKRWLSLAWARSSLLRALQEEALDGLRLTGRVLDLGGDRRSGYRRRINVDGSIETVNLSDAAGADHISDLEQPLTFPSETYDHVLCVNTLEHICRDVALMEEMIRLLKPGGSLHISVPFCHRVHGSPRDFHRHTAAWWLQTLVSRGCREVCVEPLVWNRYSTGVAVAKGGRVMRAVAMSVPDFRAIVAARRRAARQGSTIAQARREIAADYALGYYIRGKRVSVGEVTPPPVSCP